MTPFGHELLLVVSSLLCRCHRRGSLSGVFFEADLALAGVGGAGDGGASLGYVEVVFARVYGGEEGGLDSFHHSFFVFDDFGHIFAVNVSLAISPLFVCLHFIVTLFYLSVIHSTLTIQKPIH